MSTLLLEYESKINKVQKLDKKKYANIFFFKSKKNLT